MPIDPERIRVILATDCGSTTTKAILIQKVDGVYRQTHRGEAPTTVEAPFADVTMGVVNAVTEVQELANRRLVDEQGRIVHPATEREGCDIYISTSSAGGGLQMMVAGVVREMTAESAKRAALGAGAIVMDVIAANDKRRPYEQIQRIRELRPDMILISGGVDGGTTTHVVQIAELIAPARPRPRFGGEYTLPIIYAGNKDAAALVRGVIREGFDLTVVDNLRPVLERENLWPARDAIHTLFLEHVMVHAPGYDKLMEWTHASIMPTPGAVGNILQTIAAREGINVVGVDIGGATTDVFSVFDGTFNRTVSANLGMSYSIANVCAEAGMPNVLRWVHFEMDERDLRNRVKNKMIRPTTIPQTLEALVFEQAVAREALRLAYVQHKEFATTLKGVQQQRSVGDTFSQEISGADHRRQHESRSSPGLGWGALPRPAHAPDGDDAHRCLRARRLHGACEGLDFHDAAPWCAGTGAPASLARCLRARLPHLPRHLRRRKGRREAGEAVLPVFHQRRHAQRGGRNDVRRSPPHPTRRG